MVAAPVSTARGLGRKALVACLPDPSGNPRPFRAIQTLRDMGFDVWVLSPTPRRPLAEVAGHLPLAAGPSNPLRRGLRRALGAAVVMLGVTRATHWLAERLQWASVGGSRHDAVIADGRFALILVEDLSLLGPILRLRHAGTAVVYDAREYSPREFEGHAWFRGLIRPRVVRSLRRHLPQLDGFYTVCDTLAVQYGNDFGVRPDVVRSVPAFRAAGSRPDPVAPIRMVHHGNANADRGIDQMLEVVKRLNGRYTLDLYLVGRERHIRYLRSVAAGCPWIRFCAPVAFDQLVSAIAAYDIGFYLLQPTGFNTLHALPNKFFEFIQARLALLVGPSTEMAALVRHYGIGAVSRDFSVAAMVELLEGLSVEQVADMQRATESAAAELCWEVESSRLRAVVNQALVRRGGE